MFIGFTAAYCTYTVQDLRNKSVVGLYVAQKHQVNSSSEMEPYSCKTLLLNLAWEHGLQMDSFTTDRSTTIKTLLRYHYYMTVTSNYSILCLEIYK